MKFKKQKTPLRGPKPGFIPAFPTYRRQVKALSRRPLGGANLGLHKLGEPPLTGNVVKTKRRTAKADSCIRSNAQQACDPTRAALELCLTVVAGVLPGHLEPPALAVLSEEAPRWKKFVCQATALLKWQKPIHIMG